MGQFEPDSKSERARVSQSVGQRDMPQNFLLTRASLSLALPGSFWVTLARSLWLPLALTGSLSSNHWLSMVIFGSHCLSWALFGSYQPTGHLLGSLQSYLRWSAVSSPGCSYSLGSLVFKKRLVLKIQHDSKLFLLQNSQIQLCFGAKG